MRTRVVVGALAAGAVRVLVAGSLVVAVVRAVTFVLIVGVARVVTLGLVADVVRVLGLTLAVGVVCVVALGLVVDVVSVVGRALFTGAALMAGVFLENNNWLKTLSFCICNINPRAVLSKSSTDGCVVPNMVCAFLSASASEHFWCACKRCASASRRKPESLSTPNCAISQLMA